MLDFLRDKERGPDEMLPSWPEFVEKAEEYGVM
jgi:hypothetical protein